MYKTTLLCAALSGIPITASAGSEEIIVENEVTNEGKTAQIYELYANTLGLTTSDILVDTDEDCVILSGMVDTNKQYESAIILAQSVKGINAINVDNLLIKTSEAPLNDLFITAKIKAKLIKENIFGESDYWPIKVETKNSIVYLTGHVSNKAEGEHLIQLATEVDGVKSVVSSIYYQLNDTSI